MFQYTGRTALVTGASSGLGKQFAHQLAARGTRLVVTARSAPKLAAVAAEIRAQHHGQLDVIPSDLTQVGSAEQLRQAVSARGIEVDLLVNNAGSAPSATSKPSRPSATPSWSR
jgi:short-subunit dehydrogenase